jgi:hypothetical protein
MDTAPIRAWLEGRAIAPCPEREMITQLVDALDLVLNCEHEHQTNYGEGLISCTDCGVRWWY